MTTKIYYAIILSGGKNVNRKEFKDLYSYLLPYYKRGLDAVIVQDIGVLQFVKEHFPDLPIHASTQMTITNVLGAEFLKKQGVERVVTAREMNSSPPIRPARSFTCLALSSPVT